MVTAKNNPTSSAAAAAAASTGSTATDSNGIISLGFISTSVSNSTMMGFNSSLSLANSIIRPPSSSSSASITAHSRHVHSRAARFPYSGHLSGVSRSNSQHHTPPTPDVRLNGLVGRNSNKFRIKPTGSTGHSNVRLSSNGAMFNSLGTTGTSPGSTTSGGGGGCPQDEYTFISPYVKYSLFFFNLIFWIIGAILMSLGAWSLLEEYDYNLFKFQNVFDFLLHISLGLVMAGFVIFSMSFTGCLGALRENLCLIKLYSLMLLLLFVGEVILSSLAFIFPNTLLHFLKDRLSKDLITKYREDTNLQNLIDIIQMEFNCCGISDHGYKDWSKNIYFNCTIDNPSSERCAVPFSCCRDFNTELLDIMCGHNMQNLSSVVEVNKYVYTRGCVEAMSELFERNMNLVAIICLGSALAQLFAMFLARSLQGQIFAQRARWM